MISIVVPVFNVATYVEESLESLVAQEFAYAYEVILIDDCSTDSSLDICRRFVEQSCSVLLCINDFNCLTINFFIKL